MRLSLFAVAVALGLVCSTAAQAEAPDNDGDGWSEDEDCNDGEDRVNPGMLEDCADGLDNDCDSYTDDLDADCLPKDDGCSAAPAPPAAALALLGVALVSGRRRARPARSSRRCRA